MSTNAVGFQVPGSSSQSFNAHTLHVQSILARIATSTLVKVLAVTNSGDVSPVGFVDILPLVKQVDGEGNTTAIAPIFRCPYMRMQGGANAIILDPKVGDIGVAVFASRDVSSVAKNKALSNPGSARTFDMADGLYLGGMLNGVPAQFVQFTDSGITIHSPGVVKIEAASIVLDGPVTATSTITAATSVTAPAIVGSVSVIAPQVTGTIDVSFGGHSAGTHRHNLTGGGTTLGPA